MCGKFTARASWRDVTDLADAVPGAEADRIVTLRVMDMLPVIVCDGGQRFTLPMRWGFPDPADWRRPRPIHARAETIDTVPSFAAAFRDGQRGIILAETFNEAPDDGKGGSGAQHTVTPPSPVGIAMLWRRFIVADQPLLACVQVTVPANALLAGLPTDRMPAILAPEDWATWLGETDTSLAEVKACLKTVEGVRWTMRREERAQSAKRARPTVTDPLGLFG
jgi:putative SOS response-associated peptidase YedK